MKTALAQQPKCEQSIPERNYLTPGEVKQLLEATKKNRHAQRDYLLILLTYRHALRASEAISLKWAQIDFAGGKLHVERLKHGDASVHYLEADELRRLRALKRLNPESPFVFISERKSPFTRFALNRLVERLGETAGLDVSVHPHMLRHAKGFQLANAGKDTRSIQGYLGHRNIQHTVRYTKLDANRFKGFGRDLG